MEKITINKNCVGCGLCVATNPKYFEFNDEGFSTPKKDVVNEEDEKDILDMIDACPGDAISLEEADKAE